jgi:inositol transport system substrate-binding protein
LNQPPEIIMMDSLNGITRRLAVAFVATACAGGLHAQTPPAAATKTVVLSLSKASEPFMTAMRVGAEDEARKLQLNLVLHDGKGDSGVQSAALEAAVADGKIDAVVIAPNDVNALAPAVDTALRKNLPVVTVDRRVDNTLRPVPHIGVDNVLGGNMLAQWVIQRFPQGARVLHLTGQPGSSSAIDRARGVREAFAAAGPTYSIVADVVANWSRADALTATEAQLIFLKTPPDAIVADNDDMAMGALEAVRMAGLAKRGIQVIGFDAMPPALQLIRDGTLGATVDQHAELQSRTALRLVASLLRDGSPLKVERPTPTLVTRETLKASGAAGADRP